MVHVRLLHHRSHGLLNRPVAKFKVSVLIPDLFEVENWPTKIFLEERQTAGVGNPGYCILEVGMARDHEPWR